MLNGVYNVKITNCDIIIEDHGILTLSLGFSGDGWGIFLGHYSFDRPGQRGGILHGRIGTAYGMEFIRRVMNVLKVEEFSKIKWQYCRLKLIDGKAIAIGHIVEELWFDPEDIAFLSDL